VVSIGAIGSCHPQRVEFRRSARDAFPLGPTDVLLVSGTDGIFSLLAPVFAALVFAALAPEGGSRRCRRR